MKLLHIISSLNIGGAEKFCIELCNELSCYHEVMLCVLSPYKESQILYKKINKNIKLMSLNKKLGVDLSIIPRLYRIIKHHKPDIINTHINPLFYITFLLFLMKVNVFHTVHNIATKEEPRWYVRRWYRLFYKLHLVNCISISSTVTDSILKEYGRIPVSLCEVGIDPIHSTPDLPRVQAEIRSNKLTSNTRVLLSIARLCDQKNQIMLVKVFNRLIAEGEDIILFLIGGDYSEKKEVLTEINSIKTSNIHILGMIENKEDYLHCADAFCLSSHFEGLPSTLLEAMSVGVVPVCTPVGGIPDVITHHQTGFLATGTSEDEYYNVLKNYLSYSKPALNTIQKNSKELFFQKYSIQYTAKAYEIAYSNCFDT